MEKSPRNKRLLLLILFVVILPAAFLIERRSKPQTEREGPYAVVRVVDGDTIIIQRKGKKERVRLLRVNTPESVHPDKKRNTPMGKVASDFTKKQLKNEKVTLEFEGERRDRYDRLLAYVFVGEENYCVTLVEEGMSPYYTAYGLSEKYDEEFRKAERNARDAKRGIWSTPENTQKYLRLKSKWGQKRTTQ